MFTRGQIVRIRCDNLLTYENIEVFPCPKLNLIVGANGTGKSTLISAIILCLGGNAAVVGRATDLKQYVKLGKKQAYIEIELFDPNGNVVLGRHFSTKGDSFFTYNGKNVTLEKLQKLVHNYHIQIDNLCQILPQEKLEGFAKRNDHERLCETLKTIGNHNLSKQLEFLKSNKDLEETIKKKIIALKDKLGEMQIKKNTLEIEVKTINEKKVLIECLKILKQRREWQIYFHLKQALNLLEDAVKNKQSSYQKLAEILKSTTVDINRSSVNVNKAREAAKKIGERVTSFLQDIRKKQNDITTTSDKVSDIKTAFKRAQSRYKTQEADIQALKKNIEKIQNDLINVGEVDRELDILKVKLENQEQCNRKIDSAKERVSYNLQSKRNEINAYAFKLKKMNDVREQKMKILENYHEDCVKGLKWLEENRHMFRGEVFGPMFLYLNIKDSQNAKYVETSINRRDLVAFLCEYKEDTMLLIRELREKRKLKVSIVSALSNVSIEDMKKPYPIEQLKHLGFHSYVSDLISGPPLIVEFLTMSHGLHCIPIGNDYSLKRSDQVPSDIRRFFSGEFIVSVTIVRLTNERIESSSNIGGARYLASNTNMSELDELQNIHERCEHDLKQLEEEFKNLCDEVSAGDEKLKQLRYEKKKLENGLMAQNRLRDSLRIKQRELTRQQNTVVDLNTEKNKCNMEVKLLLAKVCNMYFELTITMKKLAEGYMNYQQEKMNADLVEKIHAKNLTTTSQFITALKKEVHSLCNLETKRTRLLKCVQNYREYAMKCTRNVDPRSPSFKNRKIFFKLPQNIVVLNRLTNNFHAKINCLGGANDGLEIFREFKAVEKEVRFLEHKIAKKEEILQTHFTKIDEMKQKFLGEIRTLIATIDKNFRAFFEMMGCVGTVCLYEGEEGNEDFSKYGIHIKVKFRTQGELRVLNSQVQSGGERAVSIAIYLLSLQELTTVPFRCIDEINQGMDAQNERRIFNLITEATEERGNTQYFLLSPKLLPNLNYPSNCKVFFPYNGVGSLPHKQYSQIIEKRRSTQAGNSSTCSSSY